MKFQIPLYYAFLASLLVCSCLADDISTAEEDATETMVNSTTTTTYNSESNDTIPIIILVEEDKMQTEYDTDQDYSARHLNWVLVKKITNITMIKESSVDPETKKTTDVVVENRAEEYRMFHDDSQRKVLTEKDIKSMPFPMRFL